MPPVFFRKSLLFFLKALAWAEKVRTHNSWYIARYFGNQNPRKRYFELGLLYTTFAAPLCCETMIKIKLTRCVL
jgi:hypothetical protein